MNIKPITIALTLSALTPLAYAQKDDHHLLDDTIELATLQELTFSKTSPQALSMKENKIINVSLMPPKIKTNIFLVGGHHE